MSQAIKENKICYTLWQVERANLARKLHHAIVSPTIDFIVMLKMQCDLNIVK